MKTSLVIVLCVIELVVNVSFAQVIIREKVTINPRTKIDIPTVMDDSLSGWKLPVDSYVMGWISINRMIYYFNVNGVQYGSPEPVERFSQLLRGDITYEFGRFPAGTALVPRLGAFMMYAQGWPDVDLIQEPRTYQIFEPPFTGANYEGSSYSAGFLSDFNGTGFGATLKGESYLDHLHGDFLTDSIPREGEAVLNLQLVSKDHSDIGLTDNVMIEIRPPSSLLCLEADGIDEANGYGYYNWGKAKRGIHLKALPIAGDGRYRKDSVKAYCRLQCGFEDSTFTYPIWLQTYIDHLSIRCVPQSVKYGDSARLYVQAYNDGFERIEPPNDLSLTLEIDLRGCDDSSHGYLRGPDGQIGSTIYHVPYSFAHDSGIVFVAKGSMLQSTEPLDVFFRVRDEECEYTFGAGYEMVFNEAEIVIKTVPEALSSGDTADIVIQRRNIDGSVEDFPEDQLFEIGLAAGCSAGEILTQEESGTYFKDVAQPFRFVASDSAKGSVVIRVGLPEAGGGMAGSKRPGPSDRPNLKMRMSDTKFDKIISSLGKRARRAPVTIAAEDDCNIELFEYENYEEVEKEFHEILLGETKYYHVDSSDEKKFKIVESKTPTLGIACKYTVSPVVSGQKLGVYYEYRDSTGALKDSTRVIRLIGRYFMPDSTFKVILTCVSPNGANTDTIIVEVKKPEKLGITNKTAKDVFGNTINIDSLIIIFAGENGIPPQLIKGQIEQESTFKPKWRYEPFQDAEWDITDDIFKDNRFIMTQNSTGGLFPSDHTHVQDKDYNKTQMKISKYLIDNWKSIYVRSGHGDDADIILGSESDKLFNLSKKWKDRWIIILDDPEISNPRDSAHSYLKNLIADTTTDLGKSFDRIAQTRIVTSYGFSQILYTTAITDGKFYKETHGRYKPTGTQYMDKTDSTKYPEMLNENEILFPRYSDRLLRNLNYLFNDLIPKSSWEGSRKKKDKSGSIVREYYHGFEANWKGSLYLYNPNSTYPAEVWNKAGNYLPR